MAAAVEAVEGQARLVEVEPSAVWGLPGFTETGLVGFLL
jgi:hypothetical protein